MSCLSSISSSRPARCAPTAIANGSLDRSRGARRTLRRVTRGLGSAVATGHLAGRNMAGALGRMTVRCACDAIGASSTAQHVHLRAPHGAMSRVARRRAKPPRDPGPHRSRADPCGRRACDERGRPRPACSLLAGGLGHRGNCRIGTFDGAALSSNDGAFASCLHDWRIARRQIIAEPEAVSVL